MRAVAYLFNRYPEATLTTLRREVNAVAGTGLTVYRYAHRPSMQPLSGWLDRAEAEQTVYLTSGGLIPLLVSVISTLLLHPVRFLAAVRVMFKLRTTKFRHFGYLGISCRLLGHLKAAPVDIVHTHFAQNSAAVAMLVHVLGGPPWTMTVHGPEDIDSRALPNLAMKVRAASTTIAISRCAKDAVLNATGSATTKVRVLGMGVDELYLAAPVPLPRGGPIVCTARFVDRKGHAVLIEAIDILKAKRLRPKVNLIGDGRLRAEVMADVERRGLSGQIEFCGWQAEESIREHIDASAFMVLPSYAEGLPVSIMEAFARARPVIASNVGAISELVEDGINGALVDAGDYDGLADAIENFVTRDAESLYELGLCGRSAVAFHHDARKNGEALVMIWKEIVG